jgi:hypothetical protein
LILRNLSLILRNLGFVDQVDWRAHGAVSPVQQQQHPYGSCWRFGATGTLRTHHPLPLIRTTMYVDAPYIYRGVQVQTHIPSR